MNLRTALVTTVLFASLAAPATHAANYRSDPKSSLLSFSSSYQGEAFTGHFGHFDAHIAFDPANLASSKLDVTISLDSADTQSSERDEMLKGADFFNAGKLPVAHYAAAKFRSLGGNRYAADGVLTLRGVSKPVVLSFNWTPGAIAALVGDATVNRLDFGVGGGEWADTATIGNAVKVHTALKLAAAPPIAPPIAAPIKK